MRGTLPSRLCRVHSSGIIPAYAGNTVKQENPSPPSRDHPRVCGEHYPESAICGHNRGSSPRMRGTLTIELVDGKAGGIIPAYAGNTLSLISPRPCCRDHPRVCGEHPASLECMEKFTGSSPRMRGTPQTALNMRQKSGIIPAYAGNTRFYPSPSTHSRDHPRVCGEHCACCGC